MPASRPLQQVQQRRLLAHDLGGVVGAPVAAAEVQQRPPFARVAAVLAQHPQQALPRHRGQVTARLHIACFLSAIPRRARLTEQSIVSRIGFVGSAEQVSTWRTSRERNVNQHTAPSLGKSSKHTACQRT